MIFLLIARAHFWRNWEVPWHLCYTEISVMYMRFSYLHRTPLNSSVGSTSLLDWNAFSKAHNHQAESKQVWVWWVPGWQTTGLQIMHTSSWIPWQKNINVINKCDDVLPLPGANVDAPIGALYRCKLEDCSYAYSSKMAMAPWQLLIAFNASLIALELL